MGKKGQQYASEMETYIDKKSGREITKLTNSGTSMHMYFTDNSFTEGDKEIIYQRQDENLAESAGGNFEVFSMDLETGIRTQISDFKNDFENGSFVTKSRDSKIFLVKDGDKLYKYERDKDEYTLIYTLPQGLTWGHISLSHDCRYVAALHMEKREFKMNAENYGGFKEKFYDTKRGYIVLIRMDGTGSDVIFEDTHWLGHVQFAPDTNEYISYCHEGPWNYVQQRIWILNTITRHVEPCYRQKENDSVGHEFWTRDGLIFFDNRGRGHDGTITVDRTQAVTISADGPDDIPIVGFCDKQCNVLRTVELPYYCNHYHANKDNTLLIADAVDDIVLMDISTDKPTIETLSEHNTSWRWQHVHPHPCWSWSNDQIIYASDRDVQGYTNLYTIKMSSDR